MATLDVAALIKSCSSNCCVHIAVIKGSGLLCMINEKEVVGMYCGIMNKELMG